MGRKEEIVYDIIGLPYPDTYYEALAWEDPNRKAWNADQLLNAIMPGRSEAPGYVSRLDKALYWGNGAYVGDTEPKDIERAIVRVMEEYIDLIQEALSIPGLSENEIAEIRKRSFTRYSDFIEWFSSDKYLITKHYGYGESESTRAHVISNYKPTIQSYFSLLKKTNLAITAFFLKKLVVILPEDDRKRHTYICSKTGSGKSELLKILVYSNIKKPDFCTSVIIEPHGDLCEEIGRFKENFGSDRLVYIDPTLYDDFTPSINPFELKDKSEKNIDSVSQGLTEVFNELLKSTSLSLQMETLLIPCISVLLRMEKASIKDLQIFMDDERNAHLVNLGKQSPNDAHREFFRNAFNNKAYAPTKQSIYTKIQSLLNSPGFSNFIAKPSTFDLEEELNGKKLILFNLSKGKMGDDSSEASGRFIVAMVQGIIKRRAWEHKSQRVPVHMFIDECQNYVSPSIETVLTELRKYGLHLTLANQFIGQNMDTQFKNALLSSTNIKFMGMNNVSSLSVLSKETGADISELQKLKTGEFYLKCGQREPFKLYVPGFLAGNSHAMNAEQWKETLELQKINYYQLKKPKKDNPLSEEISAGKKSTHQTGTTANKPKFKL